MPSSDPTHCSFSSKVATRLPNSPPIPLTSTRMPATNDHASSRNPVPTRSMRWFVSTLILFVGASAVRAEAPAIVDAATVSQRAERIEPEPDGLLFPIDPSPVCEVLDNFGGFSKSLGTGGHQGVDIGSDFRQEVYAVEDGVLYREFSGSGSGLGWGLHGDSDTKYRYYHLDALVDDLAVGDRVTTWSAHRLGRRHRQCITGRVASALRGASGSGTSPDTRRSGSAARDLRRLQRLLTRDVIRSNVLLVAVVRCCDRGRRRHVSRLGGGRRP